MKTSESILKISKALLAAQKKMGAAIKGQKNNYYGQSYADLNAVMAACKDHLNDNGILVLQPIMGSVVETMLLHESGEWVSSETPIVVKEEHDPQKLGSAITYARRYGLQSMVFIPAEDDDGNAASNINTGKSTPATRKAWSIKEQKPIDSPVKSQAATDDSVTPQPVVHPKVMKGSEHPATEKQIKLIAMLLDKKGQRDEDLKAKYKVTSKKDLTIVQASTIIDNLNKLPDIEVAPDDIS